MSYSTKKGFKRVKARAAAASRRDFERLALSLLRIEWPDAIQAKELGGHDTSGIDILVDGSPHLLLAAQCKGFEVRDKEIGDSQLKQCQKSIDDYEASGLTAEAYFLIVNRPIFGSMRTALEQRLKRLVDEGHAAKAELLDVHAFVNRAFQKMRDIVVQRITHASKNRANSLLNDESTSPLDFVPFERSILLADPYKLQGESPSQSLISDLSRDIMSETAVRMVLLLGEAGCGKTTTILRCLKQHGGYVLHVPAASISSDALANSTGFFRHCFDLDGILDFGEKEDADIQIAIATTVADSLLKDPESTIFLVIDGLDEALSLTRPGGMQKLFNHMRDVCGRVILTCRSELWIERRRNFATSFGDIAKHDQIKRQHVTLFQLLLWDNERIAELARLYRANQTAVDARNRIDQFIAAVEAGNYAARFGDIPRRPLFLRCILETLVEHDLTARTRAALLAEWATRKVMRDFDNPIRSGGPRAPITLGCSSADESVELSFLAMKSAARCMADLGSGRAELTADCSFRQLTEMTPALGQLDRTGLIHNSLLLPVSSSRSFIPELRLRFAHRAFQEFFLALAIADDPTWIGSAKLLPAIEAWIEEIRAA